MSIVLTNLQASNSGSIDSLVPRYLSTMHFYTQFSDSSKRTPKSTLPAKRRWSTRYLCEWKGGTRGGTRSPLLQVRFAAGGLCEGVPFGEWAQSRLSPPSCQSQFRHCGRRSLGCALGFRWFEFRRRHNAGAIYRRK